MGMGKNLRMEGDLWWYKHIARFGECNTGINQSSWKTKRGTKGERKTESEKKLKERCNLKKEHSADM